MYGIFKTPAPSFTAEMAFTNKTNGIVTVGFVSRDPYKRNTVFSKRIIKLNPLQVRNITLQYPIAPDMMEVYTYNANLQQGGVVNPHAQDPSYTSIFTSSTPKVKQCDVWLDKETQDFVTLAKWFALNCGIFAYYTSPQEPYCDYPSKDYKFLIRYFPYLMYQPSQYSKQMVKSVTPSRIGHNSKRIEVSAELFLTYSVPARFIILMHEYAHEFGNHKLGLKYDDEMGADFFALYIYMGYGFPRVDAKDVFFDIFYSAPTDINNSRKNLILKYMDDYDSGKINAFKNCKITK